MTENLLRIRSASIHLSENTALKIWIFLIVFFTFTQYDIEMPGGRQNYLLATIPILIGISILAHLRAYGTVMLHKMDLRVFILALALFVWAMAAFDVNSIFNYILLLGTLLAAVMLTMLLRTHKEHVVGALRAFIIVSVASILLQVIYNFLTGSQLDLHNFLFPVSRVSEIGANHGFGFLRFNGFHLEPGSYAANVGIATALYIGLLRRIPIFIFCFVLLTLLITRSASALIYFFLLSVMAYVELLRWRPVKTLAYTPFLVLLLVAFSYFSGFYDYIQNRFIEHSVESVIDSDGSTRVKINNFNHLVSAEPERQFLGSGFMKIDCDTCAFVNSNGAAFAMLFFFGAFGLTMVFGLIAVGLSKSFVAVCMVGMLLLSRHTFVQPNFWVPVLIMLSTAQFGRLKAK